MRFIIIHKTSPHWESGAIPTPELIARVGGLIGELVAAKVFLAGEGLRASSQGARVRLDGDKVTVTPGPFEGGAAQPAGFSILQTKSLDEAVDWASKAAKATGSFEVDVRPLTEPWDIGMSAKPAGVTTRRYMALRKGGDAEPSPQFAELIQESTRAGVHVATETLKPSRRGRRYTNSGSGTTWKDGPFSESKELIGGYVIVSAGSLEEAARWVPRYLEVVEAREVDLLELA